MPNHVTTRIKTNFTTKQMETFYKKHLKTFKDDSGQLFDFETIIPMPEHIFRGNLGNEERSKYGANNWYDWSISNWGTKWNSYSFHKEDDNTFSFETAWAHPFSVIERLSELYPKKEFVVQYADEDAGHNCGEYHIKNGEIYLEETEDTLDNPKEFAYMVKGWDIEEEEDYE